MLFTVYEFACVGSIQTFSTSCKGDNNNRILIVVGFEEKSASISMFRIQQLHGFHHWSFETTFCSVETLGLSLTAGTNRFSCNKIKETNQQKLQQQQQQTSENALLSVKRFFAPTEDKTPLLFSCVQWHRKCWGSRIFSLIELIRMRDSAPVEYTFYFNACVGMSPKRFTMATIALYALVMYDFEWVTSFHTEFWISTKVVTVLFVGYMAGVTWNCCHIGASSVYTI